MAEVAVNEPDPTIDELLERRTSYGGGAFYSIGEALLLADEILRLRKAAEKPTPRKKGGAA